MMNKLTINRETIRCLTTNDMEQVVGGMPNTRYLESTGKYCGASWDPPCYPTDGASNLCTSISPGC